jgi:hypothetical protein
MKIYSVLIISLTLGLFYSLAVQEQNKLNLKEIKSVDSNYEINNLDQESDMEPYLFMEDEFSMHVTGKEHRYLNTGISFIESPQVTREKECIAVNTNEQKTDLTGS